MSSQDTIVPIYEPCSPLQESASSSNSSQLEFLGSRDDTITTLMQPQATSKKRKQPSSPSYDSSSQLLKKAKSDQTKTRRCKSSPRRSLSPASYQFHGKKRKAPESIEVTVRKRIKSIYHQEAGKKNTTTGLRLEDQRYNHHLTEGALLQLCHQNPEKEPPSEEWNFIMSTNTNSRKGKQSSKSESTSSQAANSYGPYDPMFEINLQRCGVYDAAFLNPEPKPRNYAEIEACLRMSRQSEAPDDEAVKFFRKISRNSRNEAEVKHDVVPCFIPMDEILRSDTLSRALEGQWNRSPFGIKDNIRFSVPKPDYCVGFQSDVLPIEGLTNLSSLAFPTGPPIAFPHTFVEMKGRADMEVARKQNLHNGACAVHNLLKLEKLIGGAHNFYGNANVFSVDTNGQMAKLNCHWVAQDANGSDIYYGKCIRSWAINDPTNEQYLQAKRTLSNVFLDWPTKTLESTRRALKLYVKNQPSKEPTVSRQTRELATPSSTAIDTVQVQRLSPEQSLATPSLSQQQAQSMSNSPNSQVDHTTALDSQAAPDNQPGSNFASDSIYFYPSQITESLTQPNSQLDVNQDNFQELSKPDDDQSQDLDSSPQRQDRLQKPTTSQQLYGPPQDAEHELESAKIRGSQKNHSTKRSKKRKKLRSPQDSP